MNTKKVITLFSTLALSFTLFACGNNTSTSEEVKKEETAVKEEVKEDETKVEEKADEAKEDVKEDEEKVEEKAEEVKDDIKADTSTDESMIHNLKFSYLPENFVEVYKDEKKDLITVEYGLEKNPAQKITVQISDNKERFDELYKMPEDAEDIKVGDKEGKFWDDGSFRYLVVERDGYSIYARSTLDKEETVKIVEEIK